MIDGELERLVVIWNVKSTKEKKKVKPISPTTQEMHSNCAIERINTDKEGKRKSQHKSIPFVLVVMQVCSSKLIFLI